MWGFLFKLIFINMKLWEFQEKKYRLKENENKLRDAFKKYLSENGLNSTLKMTGLSIIQLFDKIGEFEFTDEMCYDALYKLFRIKENNPLIKKILNFELEYEDGILVWYYKTPKEEMRSLCTPFHDGDPRVPIDTEYYTFIKGSSVKEMYVEEHSSLSINETFNSLEELIEWFNMWYIPSVIKVLGKHLKILRLERPESN